MQARSTSAPNFGWGSTSRDRFDDVVAMVRAAGVALWRRYQVHRTMRELSRLNDHMLKDIGLSRSTLLAATVRRVEEMEEPWPAGRW